MTPQTSLTVALDGETDVLAVRDFAAPPARVWRAFTDPAITRQWMWVPDWPMTVCEMDVRPGGAFVWRWRGAGAEGQDFGFEGEFLVVEPPHRLVHVERFTGDPASGSEVETRFEATAGGTRMRMRIRYGDAATRAAALATGMTDGMAVTYDRLEALLGEAVAG